METLTLTDLARRMALRWRVLVVAGCAGLVAGLLAHAVLPTRYEARAVVRVDATDPGQVDMAAEEALASSRRVADEAVDALGDPGLSVVELERATAAHTVKSSRVLHVGFVAPRPTDASRGADAVANAYLAVRSVDAMEPRGRPTSTAEVVDPARVPTAPVGPGRAAISLGFVVLALLLATPVAARPTRTRGAPAS